MLPPPPMLGILGFLAGAMAGLCMVTLGSDHLTNLKAIIQPALTIVTATSGHQNIQVRQELTKDDDTVARELSREIRVLCSIVTTAKYHKSRARHVHATWGKRCDKLVIVTDTDDPTLPVYNSKAPSGYNDLTVKTVRAFTKFYSEDLSNYDWFLKADDDTYVVVENLRYMVANHDPDTPGFYGLNLLYEGNVKAGFLSGGAGYVINRETLRRFGKREPKKCEEAGPQEDVKFSRCLQHLGVSLNDSRDALKRSRFHSFMPSTHIKGNYAGWFFPMVKGGAKKGAGNMSDYPVSFHYVSGDDMYNLEYYVYHLRPYGITWGPAHTTTGT